MNLFEAAIDSKTDTILKNNKLKFRTSDDVRDFAGDSFYGDLSKLPVGGPEFIRALGKEYTKLRDILGDYSNIIIYIIVSETNHARTDSFIQYVKTNNHTMKKAFQGATFIFVNSTSKKNFSLEVDKYMPEQFNALTGLYNELISETAPKYATGSAERKTPERQVVDKKEVQKKKAEKNKEKLVKAVASATETLDSDVDIEDEVISHIDTDEDIVAILAQVEEDEKPQINKARAARMTKVNKEFLDSTVGKTTVKSLLYDPKSTIEPVKEIKVSTVNKEDWEELKFPNFEKTYDINRDIYNMLYSLSDENKTYPIAIRKVTVEDTSTSMDYILTYKAECEDSFGKRFTIKFDIPKFINNRFMMLRGNEKTMSGQLMLLPCLKTDADTVQIVSNYNKIFIRRYGMANKSYPGSDKLIKTCNKYKGNKVKVTYGDNSLICTKYDLPIDYIDLASTFSMIETKDKIYYFDQDIYFKKYNADLTIGIPYAIDKKTSKVIYFTEDAEQMISIIIGQELCMADDNFTDIYTNTKPANRLNYSQASILANKIPLIVILGYHEGLTNILKRANIKYNVGKNLRPVSDGQAMIKFEDVNLVYDATYESSMLLNGLSECDTQNYTFPEMDKRSTYLEFLDDFGGRILSDGLENFKDLFMDPITKEVCQDCRIPSDYIDLLIYSNNLLADNKYNRHTDISGNRYRTNEIVAAYFYIALSKAYGSYANNIRRGMKTPLTMKQTAVIDMILTSNISSDLSTLNPLLELTSASTVTFKGPSGMNSDRAYSLDKRTYDDSMVNKLALSTGFSANVGIDRLTTIDMDIDGSRGYIKDSGVDDMSVTKTFAMTEAVTPFGVSKDDPFRSAMTYVQTSKHAMRTEQSTPLLITNGADQVMPYLTSDTYAVKAEEDGAVEDITNDYMIIKYKKGVYDAQEAITGATETTHRMISLKETVKKNSDGGFFVTVKLDTDLKKGSKFSKGDVIAYDKYSFGKAGEDDELAYNLGVLTKVAIMNNDEGFEDSTTISEYLSEALASSVVTMRDTPPLNKSTNIYNIVKVGQPIQEGEPLIIYQNAFDEEDANALLRSITDEDMVSDLGRIRIKSKYTGVVQDIKIYRTCEISEMSDTMAKIVKEYEKEIKATKAMYKKYGIPGANTLDPDYILPQTGKMKNCPDGIIIEFYIKYNDKLGVGDKLVAQSANKGTVKDIYSMDLAPFTKLHPEEKINALFAARSFNARMVTSVFASGAINKCLIELDRQVKDIMGLPYISVEKANEHK